MRIVPLPKGGPAAASLVLLITAWLAPVQPAPAYAYAGAIQLENWMQAPQDFIEQLQENRVNKLILYLEEKFRQPRDKAELLVEQAVGRGLEQGLPPELILAVIQVESTFNERAVSPVGARGLMQIMARYHPHKVKEIGGTQALFEPDKNIHVGSRILAQYLELSSGNLRNALLRYNGSLGNPRSRYADKVLGVLKSIQAYRPLPEQRVAQAGEAGG